jgi:type VI secretion system protein ImpL
MDRNLFLLLLLLLALTAAFALVCVVILVRARKAVDKPATPVHEQPLPLAFRSSLSNLRSRIPGNRYQYRVPWVLALGESSSGKTALLDQLAADEEGTSDDDPGVCWRFLSRGALIEVPGAVLFSGAGPALAGSPWTKFLRLLLRHRAERPIDGIVLFLPAPGLLADPVAEISRVSRQTSAAALRAKLNQLQQILGVSAPVYVVVTKCDHIRGFRSFCQTIGPQFEDDIFGWSNPATLDTAFRAEWIDRAFESIDASLLLHQLRVFGRQSIAGADDLFVFPLEFVRLLPPLRTYLTECFKESSYLDPHFLRGIYFCGADAAEPAVDGPSEGIPADSTMPAVTGHIAPPRLLNSAMAPVGEKRYRPQVVFARHLFDQKVFLEAGIVRPLSRIWFARNRLTVGLQVALVLFVIVFGVGTWRGYERLLTLRDHKFKAVLNILASRLPGPGNNGHAYPVATAYDFVDDLGVLDAQGFESFFLPVSWRDPINSNISSLIAESFSDTVLASFQAALNARASAFVGHCGSVPPAAVTLPEQVDSLALRTPSHDAEYMALEASLQDYAQLREAIRSYNNVRSAGRGSFADLNKVFVYLSGRSLEDEGRFRQNPYYQRALQQASYSPVPADASGRLDDCARVAMASRIHNFFESWFEKNNPIIGVTEGVAAQIDEMQAAGASSRDNIESLVNDIRGLDNMVTGGSYAWLNQTDYNRANYPLFSKRLVSIPFADKAFLDVVDADGSEHFTQTKSRLLATVTLTAGPVLTGTAAGIRVSAQVMALQNALSALLGQDFMSSDASASLPNTQNQPFLWNKASLASATQMEDSYDKYLHEWLPLLPSGLRDAVRSVAGRSLQSSVLAAVTKAQEQLGTGGASDPPTLLLEIQSFQAAAPAVLQLQNALPAAGKGSQGDLQLLLGRQCLYLADRLGRIFQAGSLYAPALANMNKWDGTRPLTETGYGVENDDELETYFARQRDQVKKVAIEYAQPLSQYMSSHHLDPPLSFNLWPAIVADVQDYEAKKPGNAMAALEAFIRVGLNKIVPQNGCSADAGTRTGSDYFLTLRVNLQSSVTARCGALLQDIYTRQIAAFFNQNLAGNFPFGPLSDGPDAPEASVGDTLEFFSRLDAYGPGLMSWLQGQAGFHQVASFIKQAEAARQMFTGGLKDGVLFSDVQLAFRVNRAAEAFGDRIIDWEFRAGDQITRRGATGGTRWSYGNPVQITLRFAKDSPEVPLTGGSAPDAQIAGRTVTYSYNDPWALFSLLRRHYGGAADYGAASGHLLGLMRFVIPINPDTSRINAPAPLPPGSMVRVFIRGTLQVAGAKAPIEVPVAAFPEMAPALPNVSAIAGR